MTFSCICGRVQVTIENRPEYLHECNCTLCSKTGARWGYFSPSEVAVSGPTTGYSREDKPDAAVAIHFCPTCGATTHWVFNQNGVAKFGNVQMGVNMWLAGEGDLSGIQLRYPDGQAWSGVGEFGYVREPRIIQ